MKGKEEGRGTEGERNVGGKKQMLRRNNERRRKKEGISQSRWNLLILLKEEMEGLSHQKLQQ